MKWFLSLTVLLIGASATAQDAPAVKKKKKKPAVMKMEALRFEGQIQKPEAFYILQRSELNFKGLEPQKSFIPLILKSVEKEPF